MRGLTRIGGFIAAQVLLSLALAPAAEKTALFNGKNLDGWSFHAQDDDSVKIEDPWIVKQGMLISQGLASGFLIHDGQFECLGEFEFKGIDQHQAVFAPNSW